MNRLAFLLALGACTQARPPTDEQVPAPAPAPAPADAAAAPPSVALPKPAQLSAEEVRRKLQEIGQRRKVELYGPGEDHELIFALGPCQRPGADERAALRKRVLAWINRTTAAAEYPEEEPEVLALRFGCVEPAGIVIAAQMDRESRRQKRTRAPGTGHWWTLRVKGSSIAALSEATGLATMRYMEWAQERWEETVALVDLDGDGALDPLVARFDHEGGAISSAIQLSVVASRANKRTAIASFGDDVAPARVQSAGRGGPIVLDIKDNFASLRAFRCVDATLALTRCREAAGARRHATVVEIAERLSSVSLAIPDREQLAEWLDMLGVARNAAAPLLAAAPPTSPEDRAARKIARFVHPEDDLTNVEREAARTREAAAAAAALDRDLGVSACDRTSPDDEAKVRAAALAAAPGALELSLDERCAGAQGAYVGARWRIKDQRYEGLFFVQGDQVKQAMKAGPAPRFDSSGPGPPAPLLDLRFYRRGEATIALVLASHPSGNQELTAIVDGAAIGRLAGSFMFDGSAVIQDQRSMDRRRYLHATVTAITEVAAFEYPRMSSAAPAGGPAAKRLFAREQKTAARSILETATSAWLSTPSGAPRSCARSSCSAPVARSWRRSRASGPALQLQSDRPGWHLACMSEGMASDRRIDVLVIGGANFDYEIRAPELPRPGDTVVGEELIEAPGGKGANQAVASARLGAATAFVGRVGDDERGRRILAQLAAEQVDTSCAVRDPDAPTGVALIAVDASGEKMIVTAPGANLRLDPLDLERAAPLLASAKVVLLQLEAGVALSAAAATRARAARALVVLDAAPPAPLPDALVASVDVLRCNAREARVVAGIDVTGVDSAREAALALRRRGAAAACIGVPGGDLLVFETDELWLPHQRVEVVDATGAGDAFAAGIAVGLAEGRSLSDAAWLGCAAAALKTTRPGAQAGLPRRADVDRLLAAISRD